MKLFSYSSCSTCRKAIKWLEINDISFELIDILKNPPTKKMLLKSSQVYGNRKYLLNTSGAIYRSIGKEVVHAMIDDFFFDKLVNQPKLIKRPFLFIDYDNFLVGFKEEKWQKKLILDTVKSNAYDL